MKIKLLLLALVLLLPMVDMKADRAGLGLAAGFGGLAVGTAIGAAAGRSSRRERREQAAIIAEQDAQIAAQEERIAMLEAQSGRGGMPSPEYPE